MAQTILRLTSQNVFYVFVVLCVVLLAVQSSNAFEFRVGGPNGVWTVPMNPDSSSYNQWAEKHRFQIGDSILFVSSGDHDSVLLVTKDNYENCSIEAPLERLTGGHIVYKFTHSGPHYFISGVAENCHKNEKLVVVVMADRANHKSNETAPSPTPQAPSPSPTNHKANETAPSPAPQVSPPSPAPAGQEPPSPQPSGEETHTAPAPAPPEGSSPHKNGASCGIAKGVVGIFGAFIWASLALVL